jgi:hypothetical protein
MLFFQLLGKFSTYAFSVRCERFKLVIHTSVMIGNQFRHPCRAVQLGEAVLLRKPVSPLQIALLNSPNNWRALSRG